MGPVVPHLDLTVDEVCLPTSAGVPAIQLRPDWVTEISRLRYRVFTDGITNKLIGCYLEGAPKDMVLVRIYGKNTSLLIDRRAETENFKVLGEHGLAPKLYGTFRNGLAYAFVDGEPVGRDAVRSPSVWPLIATTLARVHRVQPPDGLPVPPPALWSRIRRYLSLVPSIYPVPATQARYESLFEGGTMCLLAEVNLLETALSGEQCKVVFCHNDLLLANIIYDKKKVTFIDYEYAAFNFQPLDIGNHFAEFAGVSEVDYSFYPDKEFQLEWLRVYLTEWSGPNAVDSVETLYRQVNKFSLASHLLWAAWALVQAAHSTIDFDFLGYAVIRMNEFYSKKDAFMQM